MKALQVDLLSPLRTVSESERPWISQSWSSAGKVFLSVSLTILFSLEC